MKPDRGEIMWQGILAGLLGYAIVAFTVGVLDVAQGRSFFYTAALLGERVFYGLQDPSQLTLGPRAVFAYNGLHLISFLAFAVAASWLAAFSERAPQGWYIGLMLFPVLVLPLFAGVLLTTERLRAQIPQYEIWIPGLLAMAGVTAFLLWMHPKLRHDLRGWHEAE